MILFPITLRIGWDLFAVEQANPCLQKWIEVDPLMSSTWGGGGRSLFRFPEVCVSRNLSRSLSALTKQQLPAFP